MDYLKIMNYKIQTL